MSVEIREVKSKNDIKSFVNFQYDLYKKSPMWVPPLKKDEVRSLILEYNPSLKHCETAFWLAYKNNRIVGRIGAFLDKRSNELRNENFVKYTRFEFIDDHEVAKALVEQAENWARSKNVDAIHGPLGFSNIDHQGMLVEGFEYLPAMASEYHMPYYADHIQKLGYEKEIDWIEFRITIPEEIPERAIKVADSVKERFGMKVKTFDSAKELIPYGKQLFNLMNEAFVDLFSFVPFTDEMSDYYIKKFLPLLSPKFVKLIFNRDDTLAGFIIPMPSLSEAMQKARGSVLPFGWYHIMKAYKNPTTIDLMLTGIDPKLQGMGYSALLMVETQRTAQEFGARYAETTGMIETNNKAILHWKNYEHIQHKRKRCFIKKLK